MYQHSQYIFTGFIHHIGYIKASPVHKAIQNTQIVSVQINFRLTVHPVKIEPDQFFIKIGRNPELGTVPETAIVFGTIYIMDIITEVRVFFQSGIYISRKSSPRNYSIYP